MDLTTWQKYLQNAQTDNSRKTFFRDIFQLLPGECMLYSNQNIRISRWYDLSKNVRNINNEESNIKKELNSELEKAITHLTIDQTQK